MMRRGETVPNSSLSFAEFDFEFLYRNQVYSNVLPDRLGILKEFKGILGLVESTLCRVAS